jgi:small-conductance mechanosensitive channel
LLCAVVLCLGAAASAQTSSSVKALLGVGQTKPAAPAAPVQAEAAPQANAPPTAIPLPDVAARSEALKRMLRGISDQLPTQEELDAAKAALDEREDALQARQKAVDELIGGTPSGLELREEENYWRGKQKETGDLRNQLLAWANAAQAGVQQLQAEQPVWNETLRQNESTPDLGPTLDVLKKSVSELQRVAKHAQDELRVIVNLQIRAASQDQLAIDVLDRLQKTREYVDSRIFERDSLPLWKVEQRRQVGENKELFQTATNRLMGIRAFIVQTGGAIVGLLILLLLCLLGAYRLNLRTRGRLPQNQEQAEALHITRHWIALGVLPPLLFAYLLAPLAPLSLVGLVILASFVPILILLPPLIHPRFRLLLYCIAAVYTFNACVAWISFSPTHKREMQFLANVAVFALFAFLVRPKRVSLGSDAGRMTWLRVLGIRVGVAVLGTSLVANLFGYVKLSQFLGILCIYSTFIAISVLTGVRVFTRLLLEGAERPEAQQLALVRLYHDGIVRWVPRILQWGGVLIWLFVTVTLLGLSDWLSKGFNDVLGFRIAGGSSGVTLGGVLGFFVILLAGYGISSSVRFLLREELLSHFHLSRGLPELISSMLHYLLLLLVFFFAVNAGGVELNKFTVLTGALGVGVGFGLQNIVNNFVSGLILQFERPIHIGDVLDIDGTTGKVTRIGIRSSTIKTFQGAEVIIPNGNFISGKVINWTLSESLRRVELPIGVAYGSDAKLVSKLLEQAATLHESVLTSPAPAVYFKEFADSSLNFELQFWVMQESNWVKVKSDVSLCIMELLDRAGIEIPFPQRDLRLRSVDSSAAAALGANGSGAGNHQDEPRLISEEPKSRPLGKS